MFPPKNLSPNIIVDLGFLSKVSSSELAQKFPQAKIYSGSGDIGNFLWDKSSLAYHDNIILKSISIKTFSLDSFMLHELPVDENIDFLALDLWGREESIFNDDTIWAYRTKFVISRLGKRYDYKKAKVDLARHGFDTWAKYDGYSFFVIGES